MDIEELLKTGDTAFIVNELKSKRMPITDSRVVKEQLDPNLHKINDKIHRPDKKVIVDTPVDDNAINVTSGMQKPQNYKYIPVARIALALQKLIVGRAVSFIFGNRVDLNSDSENKTQDSIMKALKRVLWDTKNKSFNRRVARSLFSCTEVAEMWYPVEKQNSVYGFDSKFKLKCTVFSPLNGDYLFPYIDNYGDLIAFSREFQTTDIEGKKTTFFETYTADQYIMWKNESGSFTLMDGFPKQNGLGKIPVVYGHQQHVEWNDAQPLIERLETLLSNFADTNDYHGSPKIFVTGTITGFAKKGETGAILEGDQGSKAEYLSWDHAPESVKLEVDTLLRMIYTITQTPDISFDSIKGIGNISGVALKLLFMDAHLKVEDHMEVFDEYLQRRLNIIKAYIGKFNTSLEKDADNLLVEPVVTPYIIRDEAAELKIWSDANGGNAVMSQKASFEKANMTNDPASDYEQYKKEQDAANSFTIGQPTL